MQPVIYPVDKEKLISELTEDKFLRKTNKANNEIYTFNTFNAPNLMREVGRIRELTFRKRLTLMNSILKRKRLINN